MLRPLDLLLVLRIQASGNGSFASLGNALGISASQAFAASKSAVESGLLREDHSVRGRALLDTLLAVKHFFPAKRGEMSRGIATAYAAAPLQNQFVQDGDPPPVWPHPLGTERGIACEPLYKSAPEAALRDPALYEYLALVDTLRIGRAREVGLARQELERRIMNP